MLTHPIVRQTPLCTRDALHGGITEDLRLHYKAQENETIQYVEVMSLYQYICKYFKFPVGHPIIHVGDACKNKEASFLMDGLIKCSTVPSQRLNNPVIPFRCNNKLMFFLCRSCAFTAASGECEHTENEDRPLNGICVMNEERLA